MLSEELSNLSSMLAQAGHDGGMSPQRCWLASSILAGLAEDARRLESVAVPQPARLADDALPGNVVRFESAGAIHSRRNLLACALWPAAVMVPMALAALAGITP